MSDRDTYLREQIARIRRAQAETDRLAAEARKFSAKAANSWVARFVTPTALVVAAIGAVIAALPVIAQVLRHVV